MKSNSEDLFLTWFFKGDFFKTIKEKITSELTGTKRNKHFILFFFSGDDAIARLFLRNYSNKKGKGESIAERNRRLLNLNEIAVLKEMLIENFSHGSTVRQQKYKWDMAMSVHSPETLTVIKEFMHQQYINFRDSESCRKYISSLGVVVCPYCDKGIIDCTSDYFYGDLDHKKDKAGQHFYLSLNIHNLSPCCKVCNQHKGIKVLEFDPALHQLDDLFRFSLNKSAITALSGKYHPDDVEIELKPNTIIPEYATLYSALDEAVKLSDRYKNMHSVAAYLYQMKRVMNPTWIRTVNHLLGKNYTTADVEKFILADYSWNGSDKIQPLTKLVKDLAKELKLFK